METRSIAMIAILAVAAVAIVGAGYAYYWGQTTIDDNQVDVQYLSVQTDMEALDIDVDFNTVYSSNSFTITPTGSTFSTIDSKNVTPITRDNNGAALGQEFIIKAPITTAANSYDLQVKISDVTIGTNATLHFGISAAAATAPTVLYKFYPTGTAGEYVAVLPANALAETESGSGIYQLSQYGFIYLEEADSDGSSEGIQVTDVNNIKCSIDTGDIEFQAMKNAVASTISGLVVTYSELDGFTPSATGGTFDSGAKTLTFTVAGTYLVKYTQSDDTFYEVVTVTA